MPKLSQLADNSVTALMSKLGFGSAKQQLLRYVQAGDGTDLSLAYDRAIAAGARTLRIPEGSWTWSTPKDYVSGLKIIGDDEIKTSGVGGTKITANNGFLKNDNTTRKQIVIKNLHIIGNRTASSVGIDGPFGGVISGCKIEGFDDLIRNLSGYLVMYKRISFANAARGLNTADANGTVVEQCHFNADVGIQLTTRDGTPQSGVNSGLPLIIRENNFNAADAVTACVKVRGQLDIRGNYFEKFSGGAVETRFIDLEVNRFDRQGAIIESNEMNGQSSNACALYINGSHNGLDNPTTGRFTTSRILGCSKDIEYGPNNRIPGFKITGISKTSGTLGIINSYRVQHVDANDEWNYLFLTSDFSTSLATLDDVPGMSFTPDSNAHYVVEFTGLMRTSSAAVGARPGITWPLGVGDGVAFSSGASSAAATTPRYGNTSSATFEMTTSALADATGSWPAEMRATFLTGTVTGPFKIGLRSGTAATSVTMKAGSFLRYKRIS